jgi:hypothetical protein
MPMPMNPGAPRPQPKPANAGGSSPYVDHMIAADKAFHAKQQRPAAPKKPGL